MSELAEPASICRPRLLWAISHQALARAELPILVEAGFDVVAEEPQREGVSIWEHDFVRYPTIDPLDSALLPVCASGDLGGRLRLVLRQGIVSTGEARDINYGFDAIMVDGPMKVAVNIASWFPGTVLWRVYGNLAVDQELDLTAPNLVCVPIFSGLLATPLGQAFGNCRALGTVVPVPPICVDTESAGRITVAVFAALISDEPWFDGWLSSLAEILGASDVAVFGVPAHNRGAVEAIGEHVRCLPRLDDEAYWREFARCSLAVYPHDIPHHSHYVPLEAILLGIPCLMTEHTAIASENVEMGLTGLPEAGVLPDRNAILWRVRELAVSPQKRRSLLREQMVLLEPFSHDNVLAQAKAIRALVSASASSRVKARVTGQSRVGIPSVLPLVRVLREGLVSPLSLAPSSICGPTRSFFHCDFHGEFIVEPDESIVKLRPSRGEDTFLRIGLVNTSGKSAEVVVRVAGSPVHRLPAVAELVNQDDPHDVATYQLERASNSAAEQAESCWSASLRVPPDSSVRLRIVGALLPVDYTVSEVTLVPLAQETGGGLNAISFLRADGERADGGRYSNRRAYCARSRLDQTLERRADTRGPGALEARRGGATDLAF